MNLIGLAGKKRSGKDTAAAYLAKKYGAHRYAFAGPLREACVIMFGVPMEYMTDESLKEKEIEFWGMSPRTMMQLTGTEAMRRGVRDDLWVRRAQKEFCDLRNSVARVQIEEGVAFTAMEQTLVISDVRFENEADWIEDEGGFVIHVYGKYGVDGDGHASEAGIRRRERDHAVPNNGSFEEFYKCLDAVLIQKKLIHG